MIPLKDSQKSWNAIHFDDKKRPCHKKLSIWKGHFCKILQTLHMLMYLISRKDKFIWSSKSSRGSWKTMRNNAKRNPSFTKVSKSHWITKRLENIVFEFALIERWHCVPTTWKNKHSLWISFWIFNLQS